MLKMPCKKFFFVVLMLILFTVNIVYTQASFHLPFPNKHKSILPVTDSTELCNIYLTSNNLLKDVRITDSGDSLFTITKSDVSKSFEIAQLNRVEIIQHGFWNGFFYGGIASVGICGLLGLTAGHGSEAGYGFIFGFILAAPAGLIVGLISEFAAKNVVYDFNGLNPSIKSKRLKYIRQKHKY